HAPDAGRFIQHIERPDFVGLEIREEKRSAVCPGRTWGVLPVQAADPFHIIFPPVDRLPGGCRALRMILVIRRAERTRDLRPEVDPVAESLKAQALAVGPDGLDGDGMTPV